MSWASTWLLPSQGWPGATTAISSSSNSGVSWIRRSRTGSLTIDEVEITLEELRAMEWTLTGSVLTETPLSGATLAGGGA